MKPKTVEYNPFSYEIHEDPYPTYKLLRLGHTSWSLVEVAWEDGPYLAENSTTTTMTATAATGSPTKLTFSVAMQ